MNLRPVSPNRASVHCLIAVLALTVIATSVAITPTPSTTPSPTPPLFHQQYFPGFFNATNSTIKIESDFDIEDTPAAYVDDVINITVTIYNVSDAPLPTEVIFYLPHKKYNQCSDYYNVTTSVWMKVNCTEMKEPYVEFIDAYVEIDWLIPDNESVSLDNSTVLHPDMIIFHTGDVFVYMNDTENYYDDIKFTVSVRVEHELVNLAVDLAYNFTAELVYYGESINHTAELLLAQESLIMWMVTTTHSMKKVKARETVSLTLNMTMSDYWSIGNVTNIEIRGVLPSWLAVDSITSPGSITPPNRNSLNTGIRFATVASAEILTVTINTIAQVDLPLSSTGYISVLADYDHIRATGETKRVTAHDGVTLTTESFDFESGQSTLDMPQTVNPGEVVTANVKLTMPPGKLSDCKVTLTFNSNDGPIPVEFISGKLIAPPALNHDPSVKDIDTDDFDYHRYETSRRKKRVVSSVLTAGYDLKDLTNTGSSSIAVGIEVKFVIDASNAVVGNTLSSGAFFETANDGLHHLNASPLTTTITIPVLIIQKNIWILDETTNPDTVKINITVSHGIQSTGPAYNVKLREEANGIVQIPFAQMKPKLSELTILNDEVFIWNVPQLNVSETLFMEYQGTPKSNILPGDTFFNVTLSYKSYYDVPGASNPPATKSISTSGCITRNENVIKTLVTQYGLIVLTAFCAILLGVLLVILVFYIYTKVTNRGASAEVRPSSAVDEYIKANKGGAVITNVDEAMLALGHGQTRVVAESESIVEILTEDDSVKRMRKLDNADINYTIAIDQEIEQQRCQAMREEVELLVLAMVEHGQISPDAAKQAGGNFGKMIKELESRMEKDFRKAIEEIFRRISLKNKDRLGEMLKKQKEEKAALEKSANGASEEEKKEMMKILKEKHDADQQEVAYMLKLEQDEEQEKLRKEFAVKKRIEMKDLQLKYLEDVSTQGKLASEASDWLMDEHRKNQAKVDELYDQEVTRQRYNLELRLAKRKALQAKHDHQKDQHSDLLNTMAEQQISVIDKLETQGILDDDQAERYKEEIAKEMLAANARFSKEKNRQESELQKRLAEKKKQRLAEKAKQHKGDLENLENEIKTAQGVDPMILIEKKARMFANQQKELVNLENEIDQEQADELAKLHDNLVQQTKAELQDAEVQVLNQLKKDGLDDKKMQELLAAHQKNLEKLEQTQLEEKQEYHDKLKSKIEKRRQQMKAKKEAEEAEQVKLREHEQKVVDKILDSQASMSEAEREKIMKEHEANMVKLENSLTLTKMQQKRMLEKRIAEKRAKEMEKIEKKQLRDTKKIEKRADADEDEDKHAQVLQVMRACAEKRMNVLQGDKIKIEDELEAVREQMVAERAEALNEQEERLTAMVTKMQLEKAQELAKIEEQRKAIFNLESSLMEELNQGGKLSDPECKNILDKHQEQQDKLSQAQAKNREKQQEKIRQRYQEKMMQREGTMLQMHEEQIRAVLAGTKNKTAAKLKEATLKIKQRTELEQLRNSMDKEINQYLEELRRENEIQKLKMLEKQEFELIKYLCVEVGRFSRPDILNAVNQLFPLKTKAEIEELMTKLGYGSQQNKKEDLNATTASLQERVKNASLASVDPHSTPQVRKKSAKRRAGNGRRRGSYDVLEEERPPTASRKKSGKRRR